MTPMPPLSPTSGQLGNIAFKSNGSNTLAEEATSSARGLSVGQRAYERQKQRSHLLATELKRERDERLNRRLLQSHDGIPPRVATEQELQQMAALFHRRMQQVIEDPQARGWYKMFVHLDRDGSGNITYWELEDFVRNELKLTDTKLSEDLLQAMWRALDGDSSGLISCGEFGQFMRSGQVSRGEDARTRMAKARSLECATVRKEKQEMRARQREEFEADLNVKRERAQACYDLAWGLAREPSRKPQPWRSPRATIY